MPEDSVELAQNSFIFSSIRVIEGRISTLESLRLSDVRDLCLGHELLILGLKQEAKDLKSLIDDSLDKSSKSRDKIYAMIDKNKDEVFAKLDNLKLWIMGLLGTVSLALFLEIVRMVKGA